MKKNTFAILLIILISLSCIFAACNTGGSIYAPSDQSNNTTPHVTENNYSSIIKELEEQILELKKDQYISESKRAEEIARLEALIVELKQTDTERESLPAVNTETNTVTTESEKSEATESDASTDTTAPSTGKFTYTVDSGKATITGFTGKDIALTIPSSIDGYDVIAIADDAFVSDTLQSVTISEGVTKVGWFAFKNCSVLRTVTIPKSVESIGYSAFPTGRKGFGLICYSDTFAVSYAESYGIAFTTI